MGAKGGRSRRSISTGRGEGKARAAATFTRALAAAVGLEKQRDRLVDDELDLFRRGALDDPKNIRLASRRGRDR